MHVTFLSYEVVATDTTRLADIAITLVTSRKEMLTDLVHEYLHHILDQHNLPKYSSVVNNVSYDLVLQPTAGKNKYTQF